MIQLKVLSGFHLTQLFDFWPCDEMEHPCCVQRMDQSYVTQKQLMECFGAVHAPSIVFNFPASQFMAHFPIFHQTFHALYSFLCVNLAQRPAHVLTGEDGEPFQGTCLWLERWAWRFSVGLDCISVNRGSEASPRPHWFSEDSSVFPYKLHTG